MFGEDEYAHGEAVEDHLPELLDLCQRFGPANIWNVEKTSLNFVVSSNRKISQNAMPGRKNDKNKLKILVCTNVDASEKISLLMVVNTQV